MNRVACDCSLCPVNRGLECGARSINVTALEVMGTEESSDQRTDNIANDLDLHLPVCDQFIVVQEVKGLRPAYEPMVITCDLEECAYNKEGECSKEQVTIADQEFYDKLHYMGIPRSYCEGDEFESDDQPVCLSFTREDTDQ